jgi:hypothetical protein
MTSQHAGMLMFDLALILAAAHLLGALARRLDRPRQPAMPSQRGDASEPPSTSV